MTDNNEKVIPNVDSKSKEERNVPDLRFKDYTKDYKKIKFGDSFKLYRGSSPRPIVNYISNDVNDPLWIKIGDMPENSAFVDKIKEHITVEGAKKSRAVFKGDMILSNSMSYGKPYILNVNGFIHDGWFVIRDYQKYYNRDYLMQLLSSPCVQKRYSQIAAGGVVLNISSDLVNSVSVSIPTIDEQGKVSNFLSLIDLRINTQKKIIGDYKLLLNSIRNKKLGYYDATNTHSTLDHYLIEYCKKTEQNNLYPVLSSTKEGIYLQSEYFNKEASSEDTTGYKILPRNYCTYRSMSDTGSFTFNKQTIIDNGIISPAYPVFTSKINNDFLIEYLNNSSYFKSSLLEMKEGGTRFALSYSKLLKLKIVDISIHEQDNYINIINSYKNIIMNEEKILSLLEKQKQYLLNKMFI